MSKYITFQPASVVERLEAGEVYTPLKYDYPCYRYFGFKPIFAIKLTTIKDFLRVYLLISANMPQSLIIFEKEDCTAKEISMLGWRKYIRASEISGDSIGVESSSKNKEYVFEDIKPKEVLFTKIFTTSTDFDTAYDKALEFMANKPYEVLKDFVCGDCNYRLVNIERLSDENMGLISELMEILYMYPFMLTEDSLNRWLDNIESFMVERVG